MIILSEIQTGTRITGQLLAKAKESIQQKITAINIDKLLADYPETQLSMERKELIKRFLLAKVRLINQIIDRKEA